MVHWLINWRAQVGYAIAALIVILVYWIVFILSVPNDGLGTVTLDGPLLVSSVEGPALQAGFQPGDVILSIDGKQVAFQQGPVYRLGIGAGDLVSYEIQREEQMLTLKSEMGRQAEALLTFAPLYLSGVMAFVFWGVGAALCLFSPVYDVRSRLIGLTWLLAGTTAVVSSMGIVSHLWGEAATLISLSLLGFLLISAHLYFPGKSFSRGQRRALMSLLALIALLINLQHMADVEIAGLSAKGVVNIYFLNSLLSSALLLIKNRFRATSDEVRRQTGIIFWATLLSSAPLVVFTILADFILGAPYLDAIFTSLALLLLPIAYAYTIHQRSLLRIDFIINRLAVLFIVTLLVFFVSISILGTVVAVFDVSSDVPVLGGLLAAALVIPAAGLQSRIQGTVNKVLYGAHYDFSSVTTKLSDNLAQTLNRGTLVHLLTEQVAKEMGIVRTALLSLADGQLVQQASENQPFEVLGDNEVCEYLLMAGTPMRAATFWPELSEASRLQWASFDWGEIFIPLVHEGELHGVLVVGSRIAGDLYSEQDLKILSVVAQQGALATANVRLVEKLRGLTQRLVRTDEGKRKDLARDLHDTVLQNLFFIKQDLLKSDQIETVEYLDEVIAILRRTIKAQRSSLIDQGITLALKDFIDDLQKHRVSTRRLPGFNQMEPIGSRFLRNMRLQSIGLLKRG